MFSELHEVKTEGSMSCKELFDKHYPLVYYWKKVETHIFNFYLNRIKAIGMAFLQIFFLKSSLSVNPRSYRIIWSFTICLSYLKLHPLSLLSPFFYICSWLSNNPPQEIINYPISLLLSMSTIFKDNRAFNIFALKNVYF